MSEIWTNSAIIYDRIFWIYFIVTLFFIIIGVGFIIRSNNPYMSVIAILWLLANIALMIIIYHASVNWGPKDDQNDLICVVDSNSRCFDSNNRTWLFINLLFIALLIISILWAGELSNTDAGPLRSMSGVLILLGGLLLCGIGSAKSQTYIISFWISVAYLLIWYGLTLYTVLNPF